MRVKTGYVRRRKHKKVIDRAKGFRMTKGKLYKVSKDADLHAHQYAYVGRRLKKRNFRTLWIMRINAALKPAKLKYSTFINLLKKNKILINRKILSELAINQPEAFKTVVEALK